MAERAYPWVFEGITDSTERQVIPMQYRTDPKNQESLSVLGFGCMRFTRRGGQIDQKKADREMKRALDLGVNYFDTAYVYPGSEVCLGRFIKRYRCRSRIHIATKLPHYRVHKREDFDRYFKEELERLQTDYVDYYLMHMLNDQKSWERLVGLGILDWIRDRKAAGQIRNIGFSFHGGTEAFEALLGAYDWDFCQIQYNYMDEHAQAGTKGLLAAQKKGIPVIVMEPLRGGRLAKLPRDARAAFRHLEKDRSDAEWGLRWVWNHPAVTVVLSGMNDIAQVEENARIAEESRPRSLTKRELAGYRYALKKLRAKLVVGCTGCGYCQPCPHGVDIPNCFSAYNNSHTEGWFVGFREYLMCTILRRDKANAGLCVQCGACEKRCPQKLPIRKELAACRRYFETPLFAVVERVSGWIMKY